MRITKISPCRTDNGRVMVYFEDRSYCKVDVVAARRLGLAPGLEVGEDVLPELCEDSRRAHAREIAARILGKRNMCTAELVRKLRDKGVSQEDADYAAGWAQDIGVVDDASYAAMLASHYRAKGFGDMRVRQELSRRGLEREIIDGVLSERTDMTDEILDFIKKKLRGGQADADTVRRLTAALQRRGHSFGEIKSAFRQLAIEMEDSD